MNILRKRVGAWEYTPSVAPLRDGYNNAEKCQRRCQKPLMIEPKSKNLGLNLPPDPFDSSILFRR